MTNLEWMRTLSATDMAHELLYHDCKKYCRDGECYRQDEFACMTGVLGWLNAEHEEPDSWGKLETDAAKHPCDYWGYQSTGGFSDCPNNKGKGNDCVAAKCGYDMRIDIIRRAKELAGVE